MTEVGRPPLLRVGHQGVQVLLKSGIVDGLEGLGVVIVGAVGVGDGSVLAEDVELQLVWPPVGVAGAPATDVAVLDGAFGHGCEGSGDGKGCGCGCGYGCSCADEAGCSGCCRVDWLYQAIS